MLIEVRDEISQVTEKGGDKRGTLSACDEGLDDIDFMENCELYD